MCRRTMLTPVVSVALAVVVATLAYRRLAADASLAGSAWATTTLLGWLWIGAAVGALPWLLSADGWGVLVGDLSVGILGAALGGLAAYAPGPLSVVTQRSGIFGVWLVVLLGAGLLSGLRRVLRRAPVQAPLSYGRGLCAAVLLMPLILVLGVSALVVVTSYHG